MTAIERFMGWLFPNLRPCWQQFWTGMLLGTIVGILVTMAILLVVVMG